MHIRYRVDGVLHEVEDNPDSIAIIRAVTGIGESFGMTTTVEGVETQEQLDAMRSEGCNEVQGFFLQQAEAAQ